MNIMIASVGMDSLSGMSGGTADGALFVAAFAATGFLLLMAAGRVARREQEPHAVPYVVPRL